MPRHPMDLGADGMMETNVENILGALPGPNTQLSSAVCCSLVDEVYNTVTEHGMKHAEQTDHYG